MREHALWECLPAGRLTQGCDKAEGLRHREVSFHLKEGSALALVLFEDTATTHVHARVHSTHRILWACDLDKEHWFLQSWRSCHQSCEANTAHGRCNLSSTTVNRVSVHRHIHEVEANTTHVLLAKRTFFGNPLECTVHMLLDLEKVLHSHCLVDNKVSTFSFGAPCPNLARLVIWPLIGILQKLDTVLHICLRPGFAVLNVLAQLVWHGLGNHIETVVLVGRLGKAGLRRFSCHCLTVRNHRIANGEVTLCIFLPQILQTDLDMELATACDHMLATLFGGADHQWVRLREF